MALAQAFVHPLIYLEYQLRKDYITSTLCEDRFIEMSTCEGRCYLVKKMSFPVSQNKNESGNDVRPFDIKLFSDKTLTINFGNQLISRGLNFDKNIGYSFLAINSLLRPPIKI